MLTQIKITAAIVAVLLGLLGVQHIMYRSALQRSAALAAANDNLHQVNRAYVVETQRLTDEIDAMESTMAAMAAEQAKIIETSNARLRATEKDLSELQVEYEKVSDFFSVPVPDDFIVWLRQTDRQNPDRPR